MKPDFYDSPYFIPEVDNWHMADDAPQELKDAFNEWLKIHTVEGMCVD